MVHTNFKRDDGFGAQFQTILFSIIYCDLIGGTFQYSPFETVAHNYDNDPGFIEHKEILIGIRDIFEINSGYAAPTSGAIYHAVEHNLHRLSDFKSFQRVKDNFYKINPNPFILSENYNVAIHFRNVNPQDIGDYGYTNLAVFKNKMDDIRARTLDSDKKPIFHFYSQGSEDKFQSIKSSDVVFHLDESVEETFRGLVFADELLMSKSSFSYCAGLLNKNYVHYQKFWHLPEPRWELWL